MAPARRGRPAGRPVARRRELRHGADRGVRLGDAGRRLRHRRLQRRRARRRRRRCWCRWAKPVELGEALRALALDPERRRELAAAARERAERFAWPRVAGEVIDVYEDAIELPQPQTRLARAAARTGLVPDRARARACRRASCPRSSRSTPRRRGARAARTARRIARRCRRRVLGVGLTALALNRIGLESIGRLAAGRDARLGARLIRAHVRLDAACAPRPGTRSCAPRCPGVRVRHRDTARGTMIGVLMSATLPARLGEPSRALIVARRAGPHARATAARARHARLPDDLEHRRPVRARRGHVRDRRPLQRRRGRARDRDDRARRAARRWWSRRRGCCVAASRRASSACSRPRPSCAARWCRCAAGLVVFRKPASGHRGDGAAAVRMGGPVACLLRAAGRARASTIRPASARPPPCCSRST